MPNVLFSGNTDDVLGKFSMSDGLDNIAKSISAVLKMITENEYLGTLFFASFFFLGVSGVKALKRAAKK